MNKKLIESLLFGNPVKVLCSCKATKADRSLIEDLTNTNSKNKKIILN